LNAICSAISAALRFRYATVVVKTFFPKSNIKHQQSSFGNQINSILSTFAAFAIFAVNHTIKNPAFHPLNPSLKILLLNLRVLPALAVHPIKKRQASHEGTKPRKERHNGKKLLVSRVKS
jgi:hypothetical protein